MCNNCKEKKEQPSLMEELLAIEVEQKKLLERLQMIKERAMNYKPQPVIVTDEYSFPPSYDITY